MWSLWLRGSESMFPVKLRSSLAFFKTHCWPSTCLLSHQTSQRFIFSCFYSLCNLNVFRVLNCWFKRWLYLDPWLVGILAPCSSRSCKSHLGMLHRWPLNIKQQVYDQNWGKSFFFYWSKKIATNVNDQKKLFCETHCRQGCCHCVCTYLRCTTCSFITFDFLLLCVYFVVPFSVQFSSRGRGK